MAARTARRVDHNAAAGAIAQLNDSTASPRPHAARIVGLSVEAQRRLKALDGDGQATAVVEGLQSALDHEQGGEIAADLDRIYGYVCFRLQDINLLDDVAVCDELTSRLVELRASWAELANGGGADRSPATSAGQRFEVSPSPAPDPGLALTI